MVEPYDYFSIVLLVLLVESKEGLSPQLAAQL
jgi:hypothetical protein